MMGALAALGEGGQKLPRMWYAATSLLLSYLGFLRQFVYAVWGRPGEPEGNAPDRSAPPAGRRAREFDEYLRELAEFVRLKGMESELTPEQAKRVTVLMLRLQTLYPKT